MLHQTYTNPKYEKIFQWGKLISVAGSAQIVVQIIGLVSGILIIRLLPTHEYGLYTIVNTLLGTMTVLADGGISAGVMAQGGKVWKDPDKLGQVLATGFLLRKRFAIASLAFAAPILIFLLQRHGAGWLHAVLILACLVPAFLAALSDSLLEIGPKLHQEISALQKNQIWVNFLRLFFVLVLFVSPFAAVAIIAAGIPRLLGNFSLRKISGKFANWNQSPDPAIKNEILKGVKRILPGTIYYCVSGQITIWIISLFGSTNSIAQIGALSRLTVVLTIVTTLFNTLIQPRYSRLPSVKSLLISKFRFILMLIVSFMMVLVGLVWLFPHLFLMILGRGYEGLPKELVLSVIGSCLGLVAGMIYSLLTCRGWSMNPLFYIPVNILSIVIAVIAFDKSTISGVMMITIFTSAVQLLMILIYFLYMLLSIDKTSEGDEKFVY